MSQKKEESSLVQVSGWDWSYCSEVVLVLACDGRSVFEISLVKKSTFCGDRTHGHWLKRPTLYHLS